MENEAQKSTREGIRSKIRDDQLGRYKQQPFGSINKEWKEKTRLIRRADVET